MNKLLATSKKAKIKIMIIQKKYPVIQNKKIAEKYHKITVFAPEITQSFAPGQFISVRVNDTYTPLLRKPFGIYEVHEDMLTFMFKVVGKGTGLLARYDKGDEIDILGPLGNGFPGDELTPAKLKGKNIAIINGGIGMAALGVLGKKLKGEFDLFCGVTSKDEVIEMEKWEKIAKKIYLSSDDGSCGIPGFITDVFKEKSKDYDLVFCCGPKIMMKKIFDACLSDTESYFFLEEYMACGIGICMGCVCNTRAGYKRICKDGPVFKGEDIIW